MNQAICLLYTSQDPFHRPVPVRKETGLLPENGQPLYPGGDQFLFVQGLGDGKGLVRRKVVVDVAVLL